MFVAESMVFSKKDPISPATILLCLSNQVRKSQLWSRATQNGLKKSKRGVNEMQNDPENNSSFKYQPVKKMTKLRGTNYHVCS